MAAREEKESKGDKAKSLNASDVGLFFIVSFLGLEVLAIAAIVAVHMFFSLSRPPHIDELDRRSSHTETYEEYSTTQNRVSGIENQEQEATTQNSHTEQERSTQKHFRLENILDPDLSAQEGMWRATNALAYITVAQTLLGALGLAVLIWTLSATRGMLAEASKTTGAAVRAAEASENAERAHIYTLGTFGSIDKIEDRRVHIYPYMQDVWLKIFVQNAGATPARNAVCRLQQVNSKIAEQKTGVVNLGVLGNRDTPHCRNFRIPLNRELLDTTGIGQAVVSTVTYTDVFGKKRKSHCTVQILFIGSDGTHINRIDRGDGSLSALKRGLRDARPKINHIEIRISHFTDQDRHIQEHAR